MEAEKKVQVLVPQDEEILEGFFTDYSVLEAENKLLHHRVKLLAPSVLLLAVSHVLRTIAVIVLA